jgi:hypothetical protein
MALSIQQSQEYMGSDRRRWSVWLEKAPQKSSMRLTMCPTSCIQAFIVRSGE